jgi:integrase
MVKVDFPYVQAFDAKGRLYCYYRRNGQKRKIDGEFGSAEWKANYDRIHKSFGEEQSKESPPPGSIADGLKDYKRSAEFLDRKLKTQKGYLRYIAVLESGDTIEEDGEIIRRIPALGHLPVTELTPAVIKKLRGDFAGERGTPHYRPSAANGLVTFCNVFVAWYNSDKIKKLKTGEGHRPGEEDEVAQFRARHPIGTLKRTAFELALNTGQRGQDVITMGRKDTRETEIRVVQEKTGNRVWLPMLADLKAALDPWMKDRVGPILTTPSGSSMKEDYFRHMMREAYEEAGLPKDFTTHGLRYTAATRVFEIYKSLGYPDRVAWEAVADVSGHATMQMTRKYTEQKRRSQLTAAHLDAALGSSVKPGAKSVKPNKSEPSDDGR